MGLGLGGGKGVGSTVIQVSKGPKYVLFLLSFSHSLVKTGRFTPRDLACWCFSFPLACTTADVFSFRLACTTAGVFLFVWRAQLLVFILFVWRAQLLVFFFSFGMHNCWRFSYILARTTVDLFFVVSLSFFSRYRRLAHM